MKSLSHKTLILSFLLISAISFGQKNKSITVEDVSEKIVWPLVYKTFKDLKLKYPHINMELSEGETVFFNYNTMLAKNRAKYKIAYANSTLTISLFNRQYLSNNSWIDNPLPMSKKQSQKFLKPLKEYLQKLLTNKIWTSKYTSKKTITDNTNKTPKGIYTNFAIAKTNNKDVNLMSFHENGDLLGIGLSEDKSTVQSLIFQENESGKKTTMLFGDDGYPKSIITTNHILNISRSNNTQAKVSIFKTDGTFLKDDVLNISDFETFNSSIKIDNNTNGPSIFQLNHTSNTENISTALSYASTAISAVTCAASLTTLIGAIPACGSLLLDVIQRLSDEDAFYYDELELINNVIGVIPFKNPFKNYKIASELIENIGNLIDGMSYTLEGSEGIYDKMFPEGKLIVTGIAEINAGSFGEFGKDKMILYAKSNYKEIPIEWNIETNDISLYSYIEKGNKNYKEGYSGAIFRAKESKNDNNIIEVKQIVDGNSISFRKKITIKNPNYYYFPWPNCDELHNKKIITDDEAEKCMNQEDNCLVNLPQNDIILANEPRIVRAILKEHIVGGSVLTDPSMRLTSDKLNLTRKIWKEDGSPYTGTEAGEFRDFVKIAPCMADWSGFGDRRQIIILVNEALLKIESVENKIKSLKEVVNQNNYQKIAVEIQELEKSKEPIKAECTEKVKKIAQKRTIKYSTSKTDKEESSKNYDVKGAEVMDFRWGKYGGPNIEMEIFFSPKRTTKTIEQYKRVLKFNEDLKQFSFSFEDGSEKPTKYALIISDKIRKEGKVKTAIRIKLFEKEIKTLDFYRSNAKRTKIE